MKKKAILKVPYITASVAPTRRPKKRYNYVAVVKRRAIKHEQHLFVEIYKNEKDSLETPVCRYVYTKKDWCKFDTKSETWHRTKIQLEYYMLGWLTTYMSDKDILKIKNFTRKRIYQESNWWEYLERLESEINWRKQKKRNDKKQRELKERCESVPELPDGFETWYQTELFKDVNYLYYKRKGRYATFYCSHCGKTYKSAIRRKETYEGQFEILEETPVNRAASKCKECGAIGTYRALGKIKDIYGMERYCYIGQQTEKGVVVRYLGVEKKFSKTEKESFIVTEIAREFFEKGRNPEKDYHLYNGYTGTTKWYNHNIGGLGKQIYMDVAKVYPGTFGELKGTFLQYSGIENYTAQYEKVALARYMELYIKIPSIEILSKIGMHKLVDSLVFNGNCYNLNIDAKRPEEMLGIKKDKMKLLVREEGETDLLKVLQKEKVLLKNWTEEECRKLMIVWPSWNELETALKYMSLKKFLNRVEKYARCSFEALCTTTMGAIRHAGTTYLDYIQMREVLGYDLNNSIIQYPRDLEDAHRKMVLERDKDAIEKREKEVNEKFPCIKKNYSKLKKRYMFEDEEYIIRPAKAASEIVIEGKILHHCVGGNNYLQKHNDGKSYILFLRRKDNPEQQYITVEIQDLRIIQWYGAYDKKPDKKKIDDWLTNWIKILRTRTRTTKISEQIAV